MSEPNTVVREADWHRSTTWIDRPRSDVDNYVASLSAELRPSWDLTQKLKDWQKHGVVIFENVVQPDLIDAVNADIQSVLVKHSEYHIPIDGNADVAERYGFLDRMPSNEVATAHLKLVNLHRFSRAAACLTMVPEALVFLHHVFLSEPALLQSLTFSVGSEQPIHQDFPYVFNHRHLDHLAAFWIPLEDIHPDSGPLEYYPGSHQGERTGLFDWGNGAINQFDRFNNKGKFADYEQFLEQRVRALALESRMFSPKKGDLLIWHGALAHRGGRIRNRGLTRKSFVGHYTSIGAHPDIDRHRMGAGYVFGAPRNSKIETFRMDRRSRVRRTISAMLGRG